MLKHKPLLILIQTHTVNTPRKDLLYKYYAEYERPAVCICTTQKSSLALAVEHVLNGET